MKNQSITLKVLNALLVLNIYELTSNKITIIFGSIQLNKKHYRIKTYIPYLNINIKLSCYAETLNIISTF